MKRVILLPLDERPCNYNYQKIMCKDTDIELVLPPKEILSSKKEIGNLEKIADFVRENAKECDGAIISIEGLVYSSILGSRLHNNSVDELLPRLELLKQIKKENPNLILYAFSLIMRNPQYSSGDEEPEYYENIGREIFLKGRILHRKELGIATDEELKELVAIEKCIPNENWIDYTERRKKNIEINKRAIELTKEGIIDFLVIPQDDSSPYGLTAKDQQIIRSYIQELDQQLNVYMYPDADAVENTLLARMSNKFNNKTPFVYIKYACDSSCGVIPDFEDRTISETIKYHILTSGGLVATSASEADIVLMVNPPKENPIGHDTLVDIPHTIQYDAWRNQIEQIEYAKYMIKNKKAVCFADVAYANGGDMELFKLLKVSGIMYKLAGYAGWNTSSNTLGTAIGMAMLYLTYGEREGHIEFLAERYLEDVGYMAKVRREVCCKELKEMNLNYFKLDGVDGKLSKVIAKKLQDFADNNLNIDGKKILIKKCVQPWDRMFETELEIELI